MVSIVNTETIPLNTDSDGVVRVSNTRVTLDTIVSAFNEGLSAEEIAQQYPTVPLADVYYVIGYYLKRYAEVEAYLISRQLQAEHVRKQNEAKFSPIGVRERLLARRKNEAI
jgi:uncharacterized protein (DUF433 family)